MFFGRCILPIETGGGSAFCSPGRIIRKVADNSLFCLFGTTVHILNAETIGGFSLFTARIRV